MSAHEAFVYRGQFRKAPNPDDFVWNGEYEDFDSEDWWCPTSEDWCMCPGPCPDGREHGPKRVTKLQAKVMIARLAGSDAP